MAQPIRFQAAPQDAREALRARIERAPADHGEAVLAALDLLQALHDRGVLDIARSALVSSDALLGTMVASVDTPESIRALRNLLLLRRVLGNIEPAALEGFLSGVPAGLATAFAQRDEPVSLWRIARRALSKDSLRGLAAAVTLLERVGRHS
jgi:uncharacterized protein YjgD (DUF1641 family)